MRHVQTELFPAAARRFRGGPASSHWPRHWEPASLMRSGYYTKTASHQAAADMQVIREKQARLVEVIPHNKISSPLFLVLV